MYVTRSLSLSLSLSDGVISATSIQNFQFAFSVGGGFIDNKISKDVYRVIKYKRPRVDSTTRARKEVKIWHFLRFSCHFFLHAGPPTMYRCIDNTFSCNKNFPPWQRCCGASKGEKRERERGREIFIQSIHFFLKFSKNTVSDNSTDSTIDSF